jgi:hypothetical protein
LRLSHGHAWVRCGIRGETGRRRSVMRTSRRCLQRFMRTRRIVTKACSAASSSPCSPIVSRNLSSCRLLRTEPPSVEVRVVVPFPRSRATLSSLVKSCLTALYYGAVQDTFRGWSPLCKYYKCDPDACPEPNFLGCGNVRPTSGRPSPGVSLGFARIGQR